MVELSTLTLELITLAFAKTPTHPLCLLWTVKTSGATFFFVTPMAESSLLNVCCALSDVKRLL